MISVLREISFQSRLWHMALCFDKISIPDSIIFRLSRCGWRRIFFVTHSIDAAELQSDERDEDGEELPADVVVEEEVHEPLDFHSLQGGMFSQHVLHLWSRVLFSTPKPTQS